MRISNVPWVNERTFHTLISHVSFSAKLRPATRWAERLPCAISGHPGHTDTHPISKIIAAFPALAREAITREGAATRTVLVAAAARLPAAFAL